MYTYDDQPRNSGRWIGLALTAGLIGVLGFTFLRTDQGQSLSASAVIPATAQAAPLTGATAIGEATTTTTADVSASTTTTTVAAATSAGLPTTESTEPVVSGEAPPAEAAEEAASTTTTTITPSSTTPEPTGLDLGYPAAPDGTPLPVIVTYDSGTVQLAGFVPSEETRQRLVGLARANSQDADPVVTDNLLINPAVPASVGVRVIELQSARFGEGGAQLTPMHIEQIDRVVAVLQALPHVSILVIGHSDQRGDDLRNLMLSEERAGAVVDYLVYLGIEPTRISMRGAGETDLLTLDDDSAAFALNRRTEFIFSGVLLG